MTAKKGTNLTWCLWIEPVGEKRQALSPSACINKQLGRISTRICTVRREADEPCPCKLLRNTITAALHTPILTQSLPTEYPDRKIVSSVSTDISDGYVLVQIVGHLMKYPIRVPIIVDEQIIKKVNARFPPTFRPLSDHSDRPIYWLLSYRQLNYL